MKKLTKNHLIPLLFMGAAIILTFRAMGQTEETTPDMLPFMLKELNMLHENKGELEEEIKSQKEFIADLKEARDRLDALTYPQRVNDSMETLMELEPSPEAVMKAEDMIRAFHDPFFDLLMDEGPGADDPAWKVRSSVENILASHEDSLISAAFSVQSDLELVNSKQDQQEIYDEFMSRLREELSSSEFDELKKRCSAVVNDAIEDASKDQANAKKDLTELTKETDALSSQLKVSEKKQEKKQALDESLFKWGLPVIICFILALTLINAIPRILAIFKNQPEMVNEHAEHNVLNTVTVFLLIISILILGIRGQIDGASLGTLLGGISGYVLGNVKRRNEDQDRATRTP